MACERPTNQDGTLDFPAFGDEEAGDPHSFFVADGWEDWRDYFICRTGEVAAFSGTIQNNRLSDDIALYRAIAFAGFTPTQRPIIYALAYSSAGHFYTYHLYGNDAAYDGTGASAIRWGNFVVRERDTSALCGWSLICGARAARNALEQYGYEYWRTYRTGAYQQYVDHGELLEQQYLSGVWDGGITPNEPGAEISAGWERFVKAMGERLPSNAAWAKDIGNAMRTLPYD